MKLHIGNKIREVVKKSGISVTRFAGNINCSRRNVYSIFDKETIDIGLLLKIGNVLEYDFFSDYQHALAPYAKDNITEESPRVEEPRKDVEYYLQKNKEYKEQIETLIKEVGYLQDINKLLKGKGRK